MAFYSPSADSSMQCSNRMQGNQFSLLKSLSLQICLFVQSMDYAAPVFHYSLPKYSMGELEHVQKRAMSIICPGRSYNEALDIMNCKELAIHNDEICKTLFDTIVNDNNHRLYKLLPATYETTYLLRRTRPFNVPRFTTDRFKNSFVIASCLKANSA